MGSTMERHLRHKGTFRLFKLVAALSIAAVMAPAVIGTGVASGAAAKGSPLTFGIVGTNTGQFSIPQEGQAFEAYVANWNAHGGYKGHPIRVIDIDGGLDPSETGDAAHTLVSSDDVIGMVGNYAFL